MVPVSYKFIMYNTNKKKKEKAGNTMLYGDLWTLEDIGQLNSNIWIIQKGDKIVTVIYLFQDIPAIPWVIKPNIIQIFDVIVVNIQEYFPEVPRIARMCNIAWNSNWFWNWSYIFATQIFRNSWQRNGILSCEIVPVTW